MWSKFCQKFLRARTLEQKHFPEGGGLFPTFTGQKFQVLTQVGLVHQGCCLTGVYDLPTGDQNFQKEPKWMPKTYDSQANFQ